MTEKDKGAIVLVERWGWASIAVNVGLSTLNLGVLWLSGSLAVAAEMVHNFVDLARSRCWSVSSCLGARAITFPTECTRLRTWLPQALPC
jgi:divalent metal cation (Fe/Co/Zn/Cd) transporter